MFDRHYTYDAQGRVETLTSGGLVTTVTYTDTPGRVVAEIAEGGLGTSGRWT